MKIMKMTCGTCAGLGGIKNWIIDYDNYTATVDGEIKCTACNGTGYTEYAVFEIEEAKQILKACGLSAEIKENPVKI